MNSDPSLAHPTESPLDVLERALIAEFVRAAGHDPDRLGDLPSELRERLLSEASVYASSRLSEVETRAHYVQGLHEARPGHAQTGLE